MRHQALLAIATTLSLTSCGDDGDSKSTLSATSASTTAASTTAAAPDATPVAAAPAAAATTAIEPYVLGSLAYTLSPDIPADKRDGIRDAMEFAVNHTNTLGAFSGNVSVVYGADTPTADASYRGQIRFGGSIGRRVALHELAHWFGSGTVDAWNSNRTDNRFTGARTVARIKAFDGPDAYLNADSMHFWPYGLNFDNEFSETQRNTQLVSAQIADMGLADDATPAIAGTRRFQNRSSSQVLQAIAGATTPTQSASVTGSTQQWDVAYRDGFITLASSADGRMIQASASGDNAATAIATATSATNQQWEMIPASEGWFQLRNRATGNCLDNLGDLAAGATIRLWSCGSSTNQQWRLIR